MNSNILTSYNTQLWLGYHESLENNIQKELQSYFCNKEGCNKCAICNNISTKQLHNVDWVLPEKQYKLEQIDEIIRKASFLLSENQYHFFILQKAELLTLACANRLLKCLEEPFPNYYFILCAEQKELIIPTIQSRCIIRSFFDSSSCLTFHQQLYKHFIREEKIRPEQFISLINSSSLQEHETKKLFHDILSYWLDKLKKQEKNNTIKKIYSTILLLQTSYKRISSIGDNKIFWMNFFISFDKDSPIR